MPPVAEATEVQAPLTPSQLYQQTRDNRGKTAEEITAANAPKVEEKRPSGDERKFQKRLARETEKLRQEFDAKIAALTPKQQEQQARAEAGTEAPHRDAYNTDEEYQEARVEYLAAQQVEKALKDRDAKESENKTISETLSKYNERMARGPDKYDDWADVLAAGKGSALNVDLSVETPALYWAIARSPYPDDIFYAWLKDSSKLQSLIDTYKTDPEECLAQFRRFEGRVGKDEIPEKKERKAEPKAEPAADKPKPRPTSEVAAKGGTVAVGGVPEMYLKGTKTLNPAYMEYRRKLK